MQYGLGDPLAAGWSDTIGADADISAAEIHAALHDGDVGAAACRIIEANVHASDDRAPRSRRR